MKPLKSNGIASFWIIYNSSTAPSCFYWLLEGKLSDSDQEDLVIKVVDDATEN